MPDLRMQTKKELIGQPKTLGLKSMQMSAAERLGFQRGFETDFLLGFDSWAASAGFPPSARVLVPRFCEGFDLRGTGGGSTDGGGIIIPPPPGPPPPPPAVIGFHPPVAALVRLNS